MKSSLAITAAMIVVLLGGGCRDHPVGYGSQAGARLFETYLNGTPEEARSTLKDEVESVQSNEDLSRAAKAARLFTAYTRLYWLERRAGQEDAALTALAKAREWNVSRFELEGLPKVEAILKAQSVDPISMRENIEKLDRSLNGGSPPKFYSILEER